MPAMWMDVDTALSEVPVNIVPLIDDTDFKTREESVVFNQAGLDLVWNFVTSAGVFTQTAVTPTSAGVYDWTNQGNGMYTIEIPASGGASINNDTEGYGWFTGFATGILPWTGPVIGFRASGINDLLTDSAYSATRGLAGTALPAAAAGAAGGLPTDSAGKTSFNDIAATAIVSGGAITTSGGAVSTVGSVTGNVGGNVVGSVGSVSGVSFPTNFADLSITATTGRVDIAAIAGTAQTARDVGASVLLSPGTGTGQISLASGAVTAGTVSDKTDYRLSATGVDDILDEAIAEPSAVFTWPATLRGIVGWLGSLARNKMTSTSTTQTLRNDADSADISTSTHSDSAGTFTRGEWS